MADSGRSAFTVRNDDTVGSIELGEETVTLKLGHVLNIKRNYVAAVEKTSDLALGRVAASLSYYDMFGNRETVSFIINEADFRAVKKILGK